MMTGARNWTYRFEKSPSVKLTYQKDIFNAGFFPKFTALQAVMCAAFDWLFVAVFDCVYYARSVEVSVLT